jgi:hypothetical protein
MPLPLLDWITPDVVRHSERVLSDTASKGKESEGRIVYSHFAYGQKGGSR